MQANSFSIKANLADVWKKEIYPAEIKVENGRIAAICPIEEEQSIYVLPGFVDSHVHIESSLLIPVEFARLAVTHGTVATVSDPHEIANVCGMAGVDFMIANGKKTPFKFYFGAPSCVPATSFETAGATLESDDVKALLQRPEIKYLSEMMNFPGVLNGDEEVMKKLKAAHDLDKPVDGHAPGLRGEMAKKYIDAGISTDHECFTAEEALDKIGYGMKILIREGSAAKNFEALADLLHEHADVIMFCSDDKHPDSLILGHINQLCARAVAKGISLFNVLQAACVNPVQHYKLDVGLLRVADPADFIAVNDLKDFKVVQTYIGGNLVAENGSSKIQSAQVSAINFFDCDPIQTDDIQVKAAGKSFIDVIEALDGQLITNKLSSSPRIVDGYVSSDTDCDILKLVVVNRYKKAPVAVSFIKNFGIKQGAIASSVAHDSHNVIAVGADDESLVRAVNLVVKEKGGLSCVSENAEKILPLPVAGLMTTDDGYSVAEAYTSLDNMAKITLGSTLASPYMTLSFMALLVIPHLKLSDKGLFDGDTFSFVN
ncbi:adenine deaminase [Danxiaibacter flavus]|uniref:Adenine deaminase n=1 Tax=Danxiaibacter flavus TaxID=3049108 RepID=A0ABV3Z9G3_9BACT|nr:adenine deaminase [Chitinophagaceae bacterium DXS]